MARGHLWVREYVWVTLEPPHGAFWTAPAISLAQIQETHEGCLAQRQGLGYSGGPFLPSPGPDPSPILPSPPRNPPPNTLLPPPCCQVDHLPVLDGTGFLSGTPEPVQASVPAQPAPEKAQTCYTAHLGHSEGAVLTRFPALSQLCQRGLFRLLQWSDDSHGGLFAGRECLLPYIGAVLESWCGLQPELAQG